VLPRQVPNIIFVDRGRYRRGKARNRLRQSNKSDYSVVLDGLVPKSKYKNVRY